MTPRDGAFSNTAPKTLRRLTPRVQSPKLCVCNWIARHVQFGPSGGGSFPEVQNRA